MTTPEPIAMTRIREALAGALNPIVLWSSGKDSLVVLHLVLRLRTVPVMWFRLPKFPEKQKHGNWILQTWNLEAFDALPLWVEEVQHQDWWEAVHFYGPDRQAALGMTTGILPYEEGKPSLCAVSDLLRRPTIPSMTWPWDVMFQGHREADQPYLGSRQTFLGHTSRLGDKALCNPIHDWSDDDVWTYIKRYKLPIDKKRYYNKETAGSPDHYPTCFRCVDARYHGQSVMCPKLHEAIPSMAKSPESHRETIRRFKEKVRHVRYAGEPQREVSAHT